MVIHQDNLAFSVINENEAKVLHLYPRTSDVTRLVIPPHVQGYRVSVIAKKAFYECSKLRRVTLPPYLRSIEDEVFGLCVKLEETLAVLPEGLFYDSAVSEVTLPECITEIPTSCFYDCRNLRRIVLPTSVTRVARDAFHYCVNLAEVVAPEAIDHIDMFDGEKDWQHKPLSHNQ